MKYLSIIFIAIVALTGCKEPKNPNLKGIWIPEKIDWSDGSFKTFYFYNDTSVVILSSMQKLINDSIHFQAEPGYRLRDGRLVKKGEKVSVVYAELYRLFTLPDMKPLGSKSIVDLKLNYKDNEVANFLCEGVFYTKTEKYSAKSVRRIQSFPAGIPYFRQQLGNKK